MIIALSESIQFPLQQEPPKFVHDPQDNSLHCVYVRRHYRCLSSHPDLKDQDVYECLNSWGFEEPSPIIPMDSAAIKDILEVGVTFKRKTNIA